MKKIFFTLLFFLATTMMAWPLCQVPFNTSGKYGNVAAAEYDTADVVLVQNIAESLALPNGTPVRFANPVYVTLQRGTYLWFKDETGALLCRGDVGQRYYSYCIIPSGFGGIITTDGCVPQLTEPTGFNKYTGVSRFQPEEVTASQVGPDLISHWVALHHVQLIQLSNSVYQLTDDCGGQCILNYGILNSGERPEEEDAYYNIQGIVFAHPDDSGECIYELLPMSVTIDYAVITPKQVGPETVGKYVAIRQVMHYYPMDGTIEDLEGETCYAYLDNNPVLPAVLCWSYDVYGQVEYRDNWYVSGYCLREIEVSLNSNHNDTADIKRINTLYRLHDSGTIIGDYFDLTGRFVAPLTAVYQYSLPRGKGVYVCDIDGRFGLVEGVFTGSFNNGDLILGAKVKPYNAYGINLMIPVDQTSFEYAGHTQPVMPRTLSIKDLNKNKVHQYLRFEHVQLSPQSPDGTMRDNTGTLQLNNSFGIEITKSSTTARPDARPHIVEDPLIMINRLIDIILTGEIESQWVEGDGSYDVEGFLTVDSKGELMLYPTRVVHNDGYYIISGDYNGDGELNIADVNGLVGLILDD